MTFVRRSITAICVALLLAGAAQRACRCKQTALARTASTPSQTGTQAYSLPPDRLAKAVALNRIRTIVGMVAGPWDIAVLWLLLASGGAVRLEVWAQRVSGRRWLQGTVFFAAVLTIMTLGGLPLGIYSHAASVAYGISIQGWGSWMGDEGKALGLTLVVATPVLLLFNWIVRRWPGRYWLGIWLVTLPLMVFAVFLSPLMEPLFNTYEPLAKNHAGLVDRLEAVVARTGTAIPPERMFLMLASEKTNGLNAYVNGMGATRRIVVWDTTAGRVPDDEVMLIFGHETGHYVLNHIPKMLAIGAAGLFFIFWSCAAVAGVLVRRFGAGWLVRDRDPAEQPLATRAGFVVLMLVFTMASFVLQPVANTISRHFEHEADVYGQEAVHGLVPDPQKAAVAAFNALGNAWLDDPNPNPFIEFWEYDHPSVKNRANFAAHYDPWANGVHGEFFDK